MWIDEILSTIRLGYLSLPHKRPSYCKVSIVLRINLSDILAYIKIKINVKGNGNVKGQHEFARAVGMWKGNGEENECFPPMFPKDLSGNDV